MKKICIALCVAFMLLMQATACGSTKDAGFIDENGYANLQFDTGYYKIPDYKAGKVREIPIGMSAYEFCSCVPVPGGFLVWGWRNKDNSPVDVMNYSAIKIPVVKKYGTDGKLLWTKSYDLNCSNGVTGKLVAYGDGFVLTVEKWPNSADPQAESPKSNILRCDKDGNILWQKDIEDYSGQMFGNIFIAEEQEIVTVGTWYYRDGKQVKDAASDLVFMKFDATGNMLVQKSFGGKGYENFGAAAYSKETGLVVNYNEQSESSSLPKLSCFDRDFNEKWSYKAAEKEYFDQDKLAVSNGFIYQVGMRYWEATGSFLVKLDKTGSVVWHDEDKSRGITSLAALSNGNLAMSGVDGKDNYIRIIDPENHTLHQLSGKNNVAGSLYPTVDGGFINVAIRNIKTVPQPAHISSIWYDTETMASRYDKDLKLVWRKTYDKYKNINKFDLVHPLEDGRLLVEGESTAPSGLFRDRNLEKAVRSAVQKPDGELSRADVAKIVTLNVSHRVPLMTDSFISSTSGFITDLEGIQYLTGLRDLNLDGNSISDIRPLESLKKLEKLNLRNNPIRDITPLSGLIALTELQLGYNLFAIAPSLSSVYMALDLHPLQGLRKLQVLNLEKADIVDISPLSGLTALRELHLLHNNVESLEPLKEMKKLQVLGLTWNREDGTGALSGLTLLETLKMNADNITSLDALGGMKKLQTLELQQCSRLENINVLGGLTSLQVLSLGANQIRDVRAVGNLLNLIRLTIGPSKIGSIDCLRNLKKLEHLEIRNSEVTDIRPLSGLAGLKELVLFQNPVDDYSPLDTLKNTQIEKTYIPKKTPFYKEPPRREELPKGIVWNPYTAEYYNGDEYYYDVENNQYMDRLDK